MSPEYRHGQGGDRHPWRWKILLRPALTTHKGRADDRRGYHQRGALSPVGTHFFRAYSTADLRTFRWVLCARWMPLAGLDPGALMRFVCWDGGICGDEKARYVLRDIFSFAIPPLPSPPLPLPIPMGAARIALYLLSLLLSSISCPLAS